MSPAVVADWAANFLGDGGQVGDQILHGLGLEIRFVLDGGVQGVDVGCVMLAMMDFHRACVNVGLEGVEGVREIGQ